MCAHAAWLFQGTSKISTWPGPGVGHHTHSQQLVGKQAPGSRLPEPRAGCLLFGPLFPSLVGPSWSWVSPWQAGEQDVEPGPVVGVSRSSQPLKEGPSDGRAAMARPLPQPVLPCVLP